MREGLTKKQQYGSLTDPVRGKENRSVSDTSEGLDGRVQAVECQLGFGRGELQDLEAGRAFLDESEHLVRRFLVAFAVPDPPLVSDSARISRFSIAQRSWWYAERRWGDGYFDAELPEAKRLDTESPSRPLMLATKATWARCRMSPRTTVDLNERRSRG
jgi:hypothetical protein